MITVERISNYTGKRRGTFRLSRDCHDRLGRLAHNCPWYDSESIYDALKTGREIHSAFSTYRALAADEATN